MTVGIGKGRMGWKAWGWKGGEKEGWKTNWTTS